MKLVHKIDKAGNYIEDELIKPERKNNASDPDAYNLKINQVDVQPVGFHRPRWDGIKWIEVGDPVVVAATKARADFQARNKTTLEKIDVLESSIDKPRLRREYAEGMGRKLSGLVPTADQLWAITKVQDVDNQIKILRATL